MAIADLSVDFSFSFDWFLFDQLGSMCSGVLLLAILAIQCYSLICFCVFDDYMLIQLPLQDC